MNLIVNCSLKICSKCKEAKELSEFRKRKRNKSGYDSKCLECSRAYARAYVKSIPKEKLELLAETYEERIPEAKWCSKCDTTKPSSEFGIRRKSPDGLHNICKCCARKVDKEYSAQRKAKGYKRKHATSRKEYSQGWYKQNKERHREVQREYEAKPEVREKRRLYGRTRYKANKAFNCAKRRAIERNSIPKWLTEEQKSEIKLLYKEAQSLTEFHEEQYEVDHIEPLIGKNSTGLTVPWNLRVIHWTENRSKGNKLLDELINQNPNLN